MNVNNNEIKDILKKHKKITIIGLSANNTRPSYKVTQYMLSKGYDIVGVNPGQNDILGIKVYPSLKEVPADYLEFIDVFRKPEDIPSVVSEVLQLGKTKILWLQMGITHSEAEGQAEKMGIKVISDRCLHIEHLKL